MAGPAGRSPGTVRAPDDRGDHFDDPAGPAGTPTREGPRHPDRSRGSHPLVPPPTLRERVGF